MGFKEEIKRRRTFGIISHPDAGKTTLTEKLLLFGGAIQEAGAVKSNKIKKGAASDFMEIERQRGISVATSVMAFEYKGYKINILDTPGHKDFAEDTYRTLTAVDSVIVVIDVAKGVEEQTEKLVQVCRMRNIPMIVFVNKLDREGRDAFDIMDDVEQKLGLHVTPMSFPIGMGAEFRGIYNIWGKNVKLFCGASKQKIGESVEIDDISSGRLEELIGGRHASKLREDLELATGIYPEFSLEKYLAGEQQPVFFGSALNNFGVSELLDTFVEIAPSPRPKTSDVRQVEPDEEKFTGFVFKIHANMDPKHRDRLAFVKIVSGTFRRNVNYLHVRQGKQFKFASPNAFFAEKKQVVDESFPGDIVGLHDTGNFKIGADGRRSAQFQRHTFFLAGTFPVYRQCRPDESQTAGKRHRPIDGRRRSPAVYSRFERTQDNRHCRGAAIRGDTVPPGTRIRRKMHIRASTGIQSVLGAAGRPCRRGVC